MPRILTNNIGLKLLSVAVAALLFSYVYSYLNYRVTQTYTWQTELRGLDKGLAIAGWQREADRVRVRVTGPMPSMRQLGQRSIRAIIDCRSITGPGTHVVRVTIPELGDLQVADIQPSIAEVIVEQRQTKPIVVKAERGGVAAEGFLITAEDLLPSEVELSGPASIVSEVSQAVVEFNGAPLSGDTVSSLPILLYRQDGAPVDMDWITLTPQRVRYSASVRTQDGVRLLKLVADFKGEPPGDFLLGRTDVNPRYVAVEPGLVPDDQHFLRLEPVNLQQAQQNFKTTARIIYPFKLDAASPLPKEAEVEVEVLAFDAIAAHRVVVEAINAGVGLSVVLNPPELVIRSEQLQELTLGEREQIEATLDVAGLAPGEYRLTPQLQLPPELDRLRLDPPTIQVTIIPAGSNAN